ncbi:MAG: AAA family ATPase [Candidatus Buchananbacteria bacterium]
MREGQRTPILISPEVTNTKGQEKKELQEALSIEQLYYNYRVKREEQLSIFDEVVEYMHYEDLLNYEPDDFATYEKKLSRTIKKEDVSSELLTKKLEAYQRELAFFVDFKKEISQKVEKGQVLFDDFTILSKTCPIVLLGFLAKGIRNDEKAKAEVTSVVGSKGKKVTRNKEKIQEEIDYRTTGKLIELGYLLGVRFKELTSEVNSLSVEDQTKINSYVSANYKEVKKALGDLATIKEGIAVSQGSKDDDSIRKPGETASIHQTSLATIEETNLDLNLALEGAGINFYPGMVEEKFDQVGNIVDRDFITAYVNYTHELKGLHDMLLKGDRKIAETGYVKEIIAQAMEALKKDPPTIVYLHGDTGSGKTALAVQISRAHFGKEPIIVSGSKFLEPDRFTEELKLQKLSDVDMLNLAYARLGLNSSFDSKTPLDKVATELTKVRSQLREKIIDNVLHENYLHSVGGEVNFKEQDFIDFKKDHKLDEKKLKDIDDQVEEAFSNNVQARYVLGGMYEAMRTGTPFIIDEANTISPEVLIAFNDLLTKRAGDVVQTRTDAKDFVVKKGFCVIWTGNTGDQYKQARFNDMDPATFSRLVPIKVKYLPQSREINDISPLLERLNLEKVSEMAFKDENQMAEFIKDSKAKAESDQIFQVLLVELLNTRLGARLLVRKDDRYSIIKDLYRLSCGARVIMDLFEKRQEKIPNLPNLDKITNDGTKTSLSALLRLGSLSMRDLTDNIVRAYLDHGSSMDIEYYLWNFVKKLADKPKEQAIIYAVLQKAQFFSPDEKWPNYQTCKDENDFKTRMEFNPVGNIDKYKKIVKNGDYVSLLRTDGQYQMEYFSSLEMTQLLYGCLPARKKSEYQEIIKKRSSKAEQTEVDKKRLELLAQLADIRKALSLEYFKSWQTEELNKFLEQLKALKFSERKFNATASDQEFWEEVDIFANLMLDSMIKNKDISSDKAAEMKGKTPQEKMDFIASALKK